MPFKTLIAMLNHKSPAFKCYHAGDRCKKLGLVASVRHILGKPANFKQLAQFDSQLGKAGAQLRSLYVLHNGMTLFRDTKSDAAGFELFPISQWSAQTSEMRESMEEMGFETEESPEWLANGVAIGQIPHSSNFFVFGVGGKSAGKLYYLDHDDFSDEPIAKNAESFISMLARDPAQFMYDRGCYARYSDGKTDRQWIPAKYIYAKRD